MLVTTKNLLSSARKKGYAVGAFNTSDLETTQAIIQAAEELKSPVIIATSESSIRYMNLKNAVRMISGMAKEAKVPIALHLDHGQSFEMAKKCLDAGYTSVMIDASKLEYSKNVALTKKVVAYASKKKIPVEAELGQLKGIEDNIQSSKAIFTNPLEAKDFVKKTKISSLAVAIGTSHGAYKFKGKSKLDIKRLREITKTVKIPLVLHGASGVPAKLVRMANKYGGKLEGAKGVSDSEIKKAVKNGISKVNVDTDLRLAFTAALRKDLKKNPGTIDMRAYLGDARSLVKETVKEKMKLFGSKGKA